MDALCIVGSRTTSSGTGPACVPDRVRLLVASEDPRRSMSIKVFLKILIVIHIQLSYQPEIARQKIITILLGASVFGAFSVRVWRVLKRFVT